MTMIRRVLQLGSGLRAVVAPHPSCHHTHLAILVGFLPPVAVGVHILSDFQCLVQVDACMHAHKCRQRQQVWYI